ncbi:unnamed protein product, partial [Brenthis ino]
MKQALACQNFDTMQFGPSYFYSKKKDVKNLLIKQFGENWESLPELEWYKRLLCETVNTLSQNKEEKVDDEECDCIEPDTGTLRV